MIDIGTNSVKLLVAEVADGAVVPLEEHGIQTRLGRGFYDTHRLQPEAIAMTAEAVAEFVQTARRWEAESTRVFATSAAREAQNQAELLDTVRERSGLDVEVISGEQEADWAYHGVTTDPELARQPLLILDVGGGSTEFILGQGRVQFFRDSFRLGAVRLLEQFAPGDPPGPDELGRARRWLQEFITGQILPVLGPAIQKHAPGPVVLVGTGGSATVLARISGGISGYNREQIESVRLNRGGLAAETARLWSLPLAQRRQIPGLPAERADVILTGAAIYEAVMDQFQFGQMRISTRGLRYAAMLESP